MQGRRFGRQLIVNRPFLVVDLLLNCDSLFILELSTEWFLIICVDRLPLWLSGDKLIIDRLLLWFQRGLFPYRTVES